MVAGRNGRAQPQPGREPLPSPASALVAHEAISMAWRERDDGSGLSATQKAVAHAVVEAGGWGDGWCFMNLSRMAWRVGCDRRSVERALAAMVANGWMAHRLDRPPSLNVLVGHYRLTPIAADIATPATLDAAAAADADASAARAAKARAHRNTPTGTMSVSVTDTMPVRTDRMPADGDPAGRTNAVHLDRDGRTRSPPAAVAPPTAVAARARKPPRRPVAATPRAPDTPPGLHGVPLPEPLPACAHSAHAAAIDLMLATKLPGIASAAAYTRRPTDSACPRLPTPSCAPGPSTAPLQP